MPAAPPYSAGLVTGVLEQRGERVGGVGVVVDDRRRRRGVLAGAACAGVDAGLAPRDGEAASGSAHA